MIRMFVLLALGSALVLPASASQPGQPLDCSDWVFLAPGLSCSYFVAPQASDSLFFTRGTNKVVDNEGRLMIVRNVPGGCCQTDCCCSSAFGRIEIVRLDGANEQVVAFLEDRCVSSSGFMDEAEPRNGDTIGGDELATIGVLTFDGAQGRVLLPLRTYCREYGSPGCSYEDTGYWVAAIGGFATTFEILQTYTPSANTLGFRVPYMPEGLPAADHFDTFTGALTNPIDFTQAQPLQCGYPSSPPAVGDYMTIADPLPNPAPSTGRYYVTAVSYQGQRRYGRQRVGGVLSGRDPAKLPACERTAPASTRSAANGATR